MGHFRANIENLGGNINISAAMKAAKAGLMGALKL